MCSLKKHYRILVLFVLTIIFVSCEDSLEFQVSNYKSKLVVEGWIEHNQFPTVILTSSAAYFSTIDSISLRNLVATRAKVTISDGETEEVLTLKKNDAYYPPYIYQGTEIKGVAGKTYFLKINSEGKEYTASTTIPPRIHLDSLWFQKLVDNDSLGLIYGKFEDDGATEDYYRIFTQRINQDRNFVPIYLSAVGDQFFNGKSFTFSLLRGAESLTDVQDDIYFKRGDTIRIKVCTIDRAHFDFWRTLERELYVTGNPFSSSGNEVISNLSGGALGVWGGYNPSIYQIIAR